MRLICLALVVAITRTAVADRMAADRLADEASALASQGKLAEAAAKFRAAYAEDPRPQLLCNVGVAYYKAGDWPRAAFNLEECRTVGGQLDASFLDNVDHVLAAVRQVLTSGDFTPVTISSDPPTASAAFDHGPIDEPIIGQRTVWLPFGSYHVHVHADGYVDGDEPVRAGNRTALTVHVILERVRPTEPPKRGVEVPGHDHGVQSTRSAPRAPSRVPAIVATAGTLVVAGLAGLAYVHASNLNDQAGQTQDYTSYKDLRASTLEYKHLSWVATGLAGCAALASGLLWYRSLTVEAAPDHVTAAIAGRF